MQTVCNIHKEKISKSLKAGKLKVTPIRVRLLDILEHAHKPLRVKDICQKIKSDIVTVYRNLENLVALGLVKRIFLDQKEAYFELANQAHHHHAICQLCGLVVDVKILNHDKLEKSALGDSNFASIVSHSLEFFGLCKKCK
jgi:Fur family ferric uptake transcriptional regulator